VLRYSLAGSGTAAGLRTHHDARGGFFIRRGIDYTDRLQGMGGTMMSSGIRQAVEVPPPPGTQRIVTFLTDGYIGNEYEILRMVHALLGDARLYAFGVGTGVNRFLLAEIGRAGRGFTRYMDPTEEVEKVAAELTERLQSPVLTDIEIDWNGLPVAQLAPAALTAALSWRRAAVRV
jgi:Ca-activated chloride channel homolog